jgi:GntR family transcriptional regulator
MLPFHVNLKMGSPVSEQIVYAVKKAIISGLMRAGDKFPSVRTLSQELRINPNTAHRVIASLVAEGLLEVQPGVGTIVGTIPRATRQQRSELLGENIEQLVVEAKKYRLELDDVVRAVGQHWNKLS